MTRAADSLVFKRVLVKLSGEALAGPGQLGINHQVLNTIAAELATIVQSGVETGIVIGGGNFFRGVSEAAKDMDRVNADYIGMLATVMNSLALQQALETQGAKTRVLSAIPMSPLVEPYVRARAIKHLQSGKAVIFAAGTGNPLFTTDTAASLRAIEINAAIMLKATRVDGVYDRDPESDETAVRYDRLGYNEVLVRNLRVMDATAISLCRDHQLPIRVFNIYDSGSLRRIIEGTEEGTWIG